MAVVQSLSCSQLFVTRWTAACQGSLSFTSSWSLVKLMSIELVMLSNHAILCCPLLLLPSIFPSIKVFSNESALCIMWPKYQSFSISPSNEYSWLISCRIDWFDILASLISLQVWSPQVILKSLLQHHNSKVSILQCSAFFIVQLSHLYLKKCTLAIWVFVSKVMSLLFNTLSRFAIAFLPKNNYLLISWLQSPSPVILEPKKIKSVSVSSFPPSIYHEVMGQDSTILVF